ncbi:MAG: hypothetical protein A2145_06180 [candidate division Zixibacteria bacterium RBG_16_40_9]|nr:MAG: hypothetical protein A2145_06180 [candidate division Zixibacteria bacterium RBG_16_40_9]
MLISGGIWQMIAASGKIAQGILLLLLWFSVISWAVIVYKWKVYKKAKSQSQKFLNLFRQKRSFSDSFSSLAVMSGTPLSRILATGYKTVQEMVRENPVYVKQSNPKISLSTEAIEEVRSAVQRTSNEELEKLERYLVFLATCGNVAPFLGLLGTIWGVMDSFHSIGVKGSASLAVVAPGIATALVATIVGLAVAIPAVIGFNYFNNKLRGFSVLFDNFSSELLSQIKKEYPL